MRRPGRLDRELEIRAPTVAERKEILRVHMKRIPHCLETKDVDYLASVTHGFVGADLSLLCSEASLAAAKRLLSQPASGEPPLCLKYAFSENRSNHPHLEMCAGPPQEAKILLEDAKQALHIVKPSAMREVLVEVPNVSSITRSLRNPKE